MTFSFDTKYLRCVSYQQKVFSRLVFRNYRVDATLRNCYEAAKDCLPVVARGPTSLVNFLDLDFPTGVGRRGLTLFHPLALTALAVALIRGEDSLLPMVYGEEYLQKIKEKLNAERGAV